MKETIKLRKISLLFSRRGAHQAGTVTTQHEQKAYSFILFHKMSAQKKYIPTGHLQAKALTIVYFSRKQQCPVPDILGHKIRLLLFHENSQPLQSEQSNKSRFRQSF